MFVINRLHVSLPEASCLSRGLVDNSLECCWNISVPERGCRERLWKRFVEELVMERDDPEKFAGRVKMANNRKAAEKDRNMLRDGKQERDQAYEREYLAHDRKRLKRP